MSTGFSLENPMAAKLMENPDILLCAELIREFLEFYKMTFTLQVFVPECNLPPGDRTWDKLEAKLQLHRTDPHLPALMQILQSYKQSAKLPAQKINARFAVTGRESPRTRRRAGRRRRCRRASRGRRKQGRRRRRRVRCRGKRQWERGANCWHSLCRRCVSGVLLVEGKSKLDPLPAIEKSSAKEEKKVETEKSKPSEDSTDKERNDLKEVDEKLEKFTAGIKIDNKPKLAPVVGITRIPYEEEKSEYIAHNP
eukprot:TRINITY_DN1887_c0_g2_i1.p1 TRINITY_DN1887_c0_g2~~TRINITY_DN1887_c0_g2_i1.p1  ORF type:complete len:253 (-),score=53.75 TRINITY_DN1887_c0_g2_i1:225-983(-)